MEGLIRRMIGDIIAAGALGHGVISASLRTGRRGEGWEGRWGVGPGVKGRKTGGGRGQRMRGEGWEGRRGVGPGGEGQEERRGPGAKDEGWEGRRGVGPGGKGRKRGGGAGAKDEG